MFAGVPPRPKVTYSAPGAGPIDIGSGSTHLQNNPIRKRHPLSHLGELLAEARQTHCPVTISENGEPVAALSNIDDLADVKDRAALAAHLADKAAGREGTSLDELDAALDQFDALTLS